MKIVIEIGDISSGRIIRYTQERSDDVAKEKMRLYDFLSNNMDCTVEDVDNFLLYALNNGLTAFIIKDNPDLKDHSEDYQLIPKFDPRIYRAFEIKDDGVAVSIQNEDGGISKNYFNMLMGNIMDDFYVCLNFYGQ